MGIFWTLGLRSLSVTAMLKNKDFPGKTNTAIHGSHFHGVSRSGLRAIYPPNTRCSANAGSMLGQRRRRWTNIEPAFAEYLLFAG